MFYFLSEYENYTSIIEILGTISFAMSGAFAAMQRRLDPFGVLIIAFVTAVGGGTIRDVLLDVPVFWMNDLLICSVIFFTALFAMIFKSIEHNFKVTLFIFDSLGLGLFTLIGIEKGVQADLNPLICIVLGTITGSFGGVVRDVLLNRIPLLLRKEIYGTAAVVGGALYFVLEDYTSLSHYWVQTICIATIVLIRTLSLKYNWQIPKFYLEKN